MRRVSILLALLVLSLVPPAPASSEPLVADAGFSVAAYNGAPASLTGQAWGGVPPYAFSWSLGGDASRFADATAAQTTFDTAGLAGAFTLDIAVTDAWGATATDSVRILAGEAPVLLDVAVSIPAGVPDDMVIAGTGSPDRKTFSVAVPEGLARLDATLSWPEGDGDLDVEMTGPQGATTGRTGRAGTNPEVGTVANPPRGTWTARVLPVLTAGTTAHLVVQGFPAGGMPTAVALDARPYGTLDAQALRAAGAGGTAPYAIAWDADDDGRFETPGETVTLSRGAGAHDVAFKVTDAAGFEVRGLARLVVEDAERGLRYSCGEAGQLRAMEFEQSGGTCWVHGGHHTYTLGAQEARLKGLRGIGFAVEQQFAPSAPRADATWPVHVQASADGLAWSELGAGAYVLQSQRQYVSFDVAGVDVPFRFVRFHNPLSASQGLSGYLDHTEGWLFVDGLADAPAPALEKGARAYSCEADLLEDFFATHPCWFGGIDRYDSPSFWHTYGVGDGARLDAVSGSFTLVPWRTDDFNQARPAATAPHTFARILTSVDGVAWTERARVPAVFGEPTTFQVVLDGSEARFVRLYPEDHARFDQTAAFAPNHHPRGFFVASAIEVEGMLPVR